jgi:hypothetical protein
MKRVRCRLFSATFEMEANVNSPDNYARCRRRELMQFLTIADVAARLDVCERTVRSSPRAAGYFHLGRIL